MAIPEPKPGLVLRYDYLWTHEAAAGQDQGKDRPACLVAATDALVRPRHVVLLPITHTPPSGEKNGLPYRPRPPVCLLAQTTVPLGAPFSASIFARLFVESISS